MFGLGDNCTAINARLRVAQSNTIWLAIHNPADPAEWVELDAVEGDDNPPQFDRRGRFFGCGHAEIGAEPCQVNVSVNGRIYRVAVPLRIVTPGAPRENSRSGTRPAEPQAQLVSTGAPAHAASQPRPVINATGPTLVIPSVNLQSSITTFPLSGASWAINPWERQVGHLQGTSSFTGGGNVVLGAHSTYPDGSRALFSALYGVSLGDQIVLFDNGVQSVYTVQAITRVNYTDVSIVNPNLPDRLTLFTCDTPTFNQATGQYDGRLVVIAHRNR